MNRHHLFPFVARTLREDHSTHLPYRRFVQCHFCRPPGSRTLCTLPADEARPGLPMVTVLVEVVGSRRLVQLHRPPHSILDGCMPYAVRYNAQE